MVLLLALAIIFLLSMAIRKGPNLLGYPATRMGNHTITPSPYNDTFVKINKDYVSLNTTFLNCGRLVIGNQTQKDLVVKSSRWWWDSNTFIENIASVTLKPLYSTTQNFGWAGVGAKEYRLYFTDSDGNPVTTDEIDIITDKFLCTDSDSLGLNS